jgi:hypothetical protein
MQLSEVAHSGTCMYIPPCCSSLESTDVSEGYVASILRVLFIDPEIGGDMFLRNVFWRHVPTRHVRLPCVEETLKGSATETLPGSGETTKKQNVARRVSA